MVWQSVVLPGTHTVTEVNRVLTDEPLGPASTMISATLVIGGGVGLGARPPPPPPPPHETADAHKATPALQRKIRSSVAPIRDCSAAISAHPRGRRRWEWIAASTLVRRTRAYVRPTAPPGHFA